MGGSRRQEHQTDWHLIAMSTLPTGPRRRPVRGLVGKSAIAVVRVRIFCCPVARRPTQNSIAA